MSEHPARKTEESSVSIGAFAREMADLIRLQAEADDSADDNRMALLDEIADRIHNLQQAVTVLEPETLDDCALFAILLIGEFEAYQTNYVKDEMETLEEQRDRRTIMRLLNGLAAALVQRTSLPTPILDHYFSRPLPLFERLTEARTKLAAATA